MNSKYESLFGGYNICENDVTKALIDLLRKGSADLRREFFKTIFHVHNVSNKLKYHLQTQKSPNPLIPRVNGHLYCIDSEWRREKSAVKIISDKGSSIPDAVIYDKGKNTLFVIESKVACSRDERQLQKHQRNFKTRTYVPIKWQQVTYFLDEFNRENKDKVTKFLIKEFLDFMEAIQMKHFSGIDFIDDSENRRNRVIAYDVERAKCILKGLAKVTGEFVKKQGYQWRGRQLGQDVWDHIVDKKQSESRISVYLFPEYFGMDCFVKPSKENFKKIISVFLDFCEEIQKKRDYSWFVELIDFRQKDYKRGAIRNPTYQTFAVMINCLHFKGDDLLKMRALLVRRKCKQIKVIRRINYLDKKYDLRKPQVVMAIFKETFHTLARFRDRIEECLKNDKKKTTGISKE